MGGGYSWRDGLFRSCTPRGDKVTMGRRKEREGWGGGLFIRVCMDVCIYRPIPVWLFSVTTWDLGKNAGECKDRLGELNKANVCYKWSGECALMTHTCSLVQPMVQRGSEEC